MAKSQAKKPHVAVKSEPKSQNDKVAAKVSSSVEPPSTRSGKFGGKVPIYILIVTALTNTKVYGRAIN